MADRTLPDTSALLPWIDLAFETDFERWSPPEAPGDDRIVDIAEGERRVPETHDGWMPPHMIESDIQSFFG
jgi:hypothetical protein